MNPGGGILGQEVTIVTLLWPPQTLSDPLKKWCFWALETKKNFSPGAFRDQKWTVLTEPDWLVQKKQTSNDNAEWTIMSPKNGIIEFLGDAIICMDVVNDATFGGTVQHTTRQQAAAK